MQQSPVLLKLLVNRVQQTEAEDAAKNVVQDEAVTKDVAGEADTST